jgi:hypothetical protein
LKLVSDECRFGHNVATDEPDVAQLVSKRAGLVMDVLSLGLPGIFFSSYVGSGSIMNRKLNRRIYLDQEQEIVTVALRAKPPVLMSESADEYAALHRRLVDEIRPQGPIEALYVEEITDLIWTIQRLRNFKITIIILASRRSLVNILTELLTIHGKIKVDSLAKKWFDEDEDESSAAKEEVRKILQRFNLDESVIEAEAIKLVADQLDWLDKNLASASSRLDKSLRFIKSYRIDFANELRRQSDRLLNLPAARQAT